ncbi:MAG: hypothetical protein EOR57_31415 [Mesorhizobium sp.]|uniref:hypothetical protein n=1 Tax=Mesorhizobium sp. TaxID=1871066 RepID=UPI000FE47A9D|nr:hypothetical protein [Mesorhizobium sp.]RWL14856.1 MAG: hypothetical protein EOR57_31415 [Mesorhizobium sp.]
MRNILTTPKEVIDELGGYNEVAAMVGLKYTAVFEWGRDGKRIPPKFYKLMTDELRQRGKQAPPSVWGMVEESAA